MNRAVVLSCAVALSPSLFACGPKPEAAASKPAAMALAPLAVQTVPVEVRAMPRVLTLPGNVIADRQSEVAANVSGRVVSAAIERGQQVKAGETLVTVDSKAAGFSMAASNAQAQLADAQALQAKEDCARADRLHGQGAMAQAEYDRQKSQCQTQQFQANAARAQADLNAKLAGGHHHPRAVQRRHRRALRQRRRVRAAVHPGGIDLRARPGAGQHQRAGVGGGPGPEVRRSTLHVSA